MQYVMNVAEFPVDPALVTLHPSPSTGATLTGFATPYFGCLIYLHASLYIILV